MTAKAEGEGEASAPGRKRRRGLVVAGALALLAAPNGFAAAHAWALTHYAQGGERIPGAGHVSLVGAAPEAWEAATTALLDEVCPP